MRAYERLLKYVTYDTQSSETSGTHPSSEKQRALALLLREELSALGISDVHLSDDCYVYARIPATSGYEGAVRLGFIAHLDTAPDFSGTDVRPTVIDNYDGGDVVLSDSGRILSPRTFPHLESLRGRTLITTDGRTLLGADDKAGIAEIMTLAEALTEGDISHGEVLIAFTPDEEIGEGADGFDIARFGAQFAYTVDGGSEGSLEYENFNAAGAVIKIHGQNVHPGSAKGTMKNASLIAMELNSSLPASDVPSRTEGYEGFYHLTSMEGTVESATLSYIIRDHDSAGFEFRKSLLLHAVKCLNEKYGEGTVEATVTDSYRNMKEMIAPHPHLIENAISATKAAGITPTVLPIRGGTDGARLSFMGLPCPNLGTGGFAFHGPFEHITAEGMDSVTEILMNLTQIYKNIKA